MWRSAAGIFLSSKRDDTTETRVNTTSPIAFTLTTALDAGFLSAFVHIALTRSFVSLDGIADFAIPF